jgi:hypothetical protein
MRCFVLAALIGVLSATALAAQTIPSPYRFIEHGQDLGVFASRVGTDRGTVNLGPRGGFAYGVEYAFRLGDPIAIRGRATYLPTERDIIDTVTVNGQPTTQSEGRAALDLLIVTATLRFTLTGARTWHGIAPYVVLGGGLAIATSEEETPITIAVDNRYTFDHEFMGQIGFGAAVFLGERWALRLSVLDDLWKIDAPRGLQDVNLLPTAPSSEWTHNLELSAGLHFHF